MKAYKIWQNAWKEDYLEPISITFPESWDVQFQEMTGDNWPSLTKEQIREKIQNPIGMQPIRELARNGKEAVILFDDLSRGTQVKEIAEIVLEELHAGGMAKEHIRFICALGTHGTHTRADFVLKLGEEIVQNYPVFNHNCFYSCIKIGEDAYGAPVEISKEFMECDVRIGIGSCSPHPMNGYGGGGKILFPGIASINTTAANHMRKQFQKPGDPKPCGLRRDIEEMTRMVGSFFKIDAIINAHLDTIDLFAGDPIEEYYQAIQASGRANAMPYSKDLKDVVVANANAKYNESLVAAMVAEMQLKSGGDIVLVNHCPAGQAVHYALGSFGCDRGGPAYTPLAKRRVQDIRRIIYYTPFPVVANTLIILEPQKIVFAKTWDEVLALLGDRGAGTKVSVLSDATIGYFPEIIG